MLPPLLAAATTVASDGFTVDPELGFLAQLAFESWEIGPAVSRAGLAVLVLVARWRGRVTVPVGGLGLLASTTWEIWSIATDDSSTAAIGVVFLPLSVWPLVILTSAVVLLRTRPRRAAAAAVPRS